MTASHSQTNTQIDLFMLPSRPRQLDCLIWEVSRAMPAHQTISQVPRGHFRVLTEQVKAAAPFRGLAQQPFSSFNGSLSRIM